jgi:hypothetical protein
MTIIRYSVLVSTNGLIESLREFTCKASNTGFVVNRTSNFGGNTTRVKKEELLRVDSMIRELVSQIQYYTWCLPEDIETAKKIVNERVLSKAIENHSITKQLLDYLK